MPFQMWKEEKKKRNNLCLSFAYLKVAIILQKCKLKGSGQKNYVYIIYFHLYGKRNDASVKINSAVDRLNKLEMYLSPT